MVNEPSMGTMANKPYVQFAREHRSLELKQRALAKQERLAKETEKSNTVQIATE